MIGGIRDTTYYHDLGEKKPDSKAALPSFPVVDRGGVGGGGGGSIGK